MKTRRDYVSRPGAIAMVAAYVWLTMELTQDAQGVRDRLLYADAVVFVAALIAAAVAVPRSTMQRIARAIMLVATGLSIALNAFKLERVVDALLNEPKTLTPMGLFHTSVALWFANILIFTLAYWLIDAGGPEAREEGTAERCDFDFPARSDPSKLGPEWQPTLLDYLFVAFTTNTSFGPTEAMPITARAKALMILQSFISLVTIAGVAARAIGATGQ